jgi:glutaminyl-tRNA synthetase
VRLKYGYVVQCTGFTRRSDGSIAQVQAVLIAGTKSGTAGADSVKTKGVLTWVGVHDGLAAELRLYDRLFTDPQPDQAGRDFKAFLNPNSQRTVRGWLEPSIATAQPGQRLQFERHGYFVADVLDHAASRPVFNRSTTLKDTWAR